MWLLSSLDKDKDKDKDIDKGKNVDEDKGEDKDKNNDNKKSNDKVEIKDEDRTTENWKEILINRKMKNGKKRDGNEKYREK